MRSKLGPQRFIRHQVDHAAEQVFQIKLGAEVARRGGWPVERYEDIDVAGIAGLVARGRAKQGAPLRRTPGKFGFVLC